MARGEGLRQRLNRRDGGLAQRHEDGLLPMSLECLYVAGCLGLRERAKGEGLPGYGEIWHHRIDELQEYSARWPSLVKLARRMEVAWSVACCRGHMVLGDEHFSERADGLLHLG